MGKDRKMGRSDGSGEAESFVTSPIGKVQSTLIRESGRKVDNVRKPKSAASILILYRSLCVVGRGGIHRLHAYFHTERAVAQIIVWRGQLVRRRPIRRTTLAS